MTGQMHTTPGLAAPAGDAPIDAAAHPHRTLEQAIEAFAQALGALHHTLASVPEESSTRPARWTAHLRRTNTGPTPAADTLHQHVESPRWRRMDTRPSSAHKALATQHAVLERSAHQTAWNAQEARVAQRLAPRVLDAAATLLAAIAVHHPQMDMALFVQPPHALVQIAPTLDKGRPLTTQSLRLPDERGAFARLCRLFLEPPTTGALHWKIDAVFHHLPHLTRPTFAERCFQGVVQANDAGGVRGACAVLGANAALLPTRLESFAFWKAPDAGDLLAYEAQADLDSRQAETPTPD